MMMQKHVRKCDFVWSAYLHFLTKYGNVCINVVVNHPQQSHFLKKNFRLKVYNFIKKRIQHSCFSVKFRKFFRASIICERLLFIRDTGLRTLHKKLSFPLRISSVNVTKSDLGTFTVKILNFSFCAVQCIPYIYRLPTLQNTLFQYFLLSIKLNAQS